MKVLSAIVGITVLAFSVTSTLAAHMLSMPQRHSLSRGKAPGTLGARLFLPADGMVRDVLIRL